MSSHDSETPDLRILDDADAILLEGIEIPAALGVSAAERDMRRPVRLDLEIGRDLRQAGATDELDRTLDYGEIYGVVQEVAGGREHALVEALAERIVAALFERFDIDWVRIEVRKPKPIAGVLEHAGIRITRRR
jgi:dihydroneopterin aldolase